MLNSQETRNYRNVLRLKSREITFQQYRENLAKAGVFRWVTNIHEHKRYYYTFDNSLLFTESIQNTTQIFPMPNLDNVRFLPYQHRGVGIMQYVRAKPCVHRFNYSRTLLQRKLLVRAVTVNLGIQMTIHRTWHINNIIIWNFNSLFRFV